MEQLANKRFEDLTEDEIDQVLMDESDDGDWPTCTLKDGTHYEWDEKLRVVVETATDGRQYVVSVVGNQLVRLRELTVASVA